MKLEKDIPNIPDVENIPGSDVENWTDFIDRTDSLVKTEPPPLDELPGHRSVVLTTDTDDEILKLENSDPESVENEESGSDCSFDVTDDDILTPKTPFF